MRNPCLPRAARLSVVVVALLAGACASPSKKIEAFHVAWSAGDLAVAEAEIDYLIAKETGVEQEIVKESHGLHETIEVDDGDAYLYMLEKATCRMMAGDYDSAIDLLRGCRDVMFEKADDKDIAGYFAGTATDDTAIDFTGADYELLLIPTMLTLVDLLNGGDEAYSYSVQIGAKQEEIIGDDFGSVIDEESGEETGYKPRELYDRIGIGAYLEGVLNESRFAPDEAAKAYERAQEWSGGAGVIEQAIAYNTGDARAPEGSGTIHVFYLPGRGPRLLEGTSEVSDFALNLARIGAILGAVDIGVVAQAPVPVPVVHSYDTAIAPLYVDFNGEEYTTETILDVHQVAQNQLDANMPWILARAAVRRAFKAFVAKQAGDAVGESDALLGALTSIAVNVATTATENADTRNWTSLPAQFQTTRIYAPEGEHVLDLGRGMTAGVRVRKGESAYVVVMHPALQLPGTVLVDVYSQYEPPAPEPAPVEVPEEIPEV